MATTPNYEMKRIIGSGVFGYVFEAEDRVTKKKYALKRIEKVSNQLSREFEILHLIKGCRNVVKIEDWLKQDYFYSKNGQGKLIQNMVFEFVDDNLESLIERHSKAGTRIPHHDIKNYMYQLLSGLKWIHAKKIAHRDLKPQNVLLSKTGVIKICDFGCSKVIDNKGNNTPYIVSRYYRAPELILCITKYTVSIDIWAAGCILAELILQIPFFKGKTEGDQLFQIMETMGSFTEAETNYFKNQVVFDSRLLDSFPSYRRKNLMDIFPMAEDRKNLVDLLSKMLAYVPSKRLTAEQAMAHPYFKDVHLAISDSKGTVVEESDDTLDIVVGKI